MTWEFTLTVLEPPSSTNLDHRSFSVSYEEYDELFPAKQCATNLQLTSLIPKGLAISINNVPSALNPIIAAASFEISASQISFMGALTSQSSQLQSQSTSQRQSKSTQVSTPTMRLGTLVLSAVYTSQPATYDINLDMSILLTGNPQPGSQDPVPMPSLLSGQLSYDSGSQVWSVGATIQDLNLATLWELYDSGSQDGISKALGARTVWTLDITYTFSSGGGDNRFTTDATLVFLNVINLDLQYNYHQGGTWTFSATLNTLSNLSVLQGLTVGQLVAEINSGISLPTYVDQISLFPSNGNFNLAINAKKIALNLGEVAVFTTVELNIADIDILFGLCVPTGPQSPTIILRIVLPKMPDIKRAAIVDTLTQPFDEMYFLYVSTDQGATAQGITSEQL
jgi:hypothetical protein